MATGGHRAQTHKPESKFIRPETKQLSQGNTEKNSPHEAGYSVKQLLFF